VLFKVRKQASKDKIREAIEHLFKVTVVKVRTSNYMAKNAARRNEGPPDGLEKKPT